MSEPAPAPLSELVPELTDGIVRLRAHRLEDAPRIVEQSNDPESLRWTTVPRPYGLEDAKGFVGIIDADWREPIGSRLWAICRADDPEGQFAGTIDLRRGPGRTASVGFGLHPGARGAGLMARALRLVTRFAFDEEPWGAPIERVHWSAIEGNWASRHTAWACGYTFHGMIPGTHPNPDDADAPALNTWYASAARGDDLSPKGQWFTSPVLEGKGIRLRPFRGDEGPDQEVRSDPAHWFPTSFIISPESFSARFQRMQGFMAAGEAVIWCVADRDSDRALGMINVFGPHGSTLSDDVAELGYQLNPSARGRGVGKEAARLVVEYATRATSQGGLGLRRLVAETAADNEASNAVLRAVGFVEYGRQHAMDALPDGTYGDAIHWERLT